MILISASYQALMRARQGNRETEICNSAIIIVFAGFYIEANLNYIIDKLGKTADVERYFSKNAGLQSKAVWFYNEFISANKTSKISDRDYKMMQKEFHGLEEIAEFRNDIAHGKIPIEMATLEHSEELRANAKEIVEKLFKAVENQTGIDLSRNITYKTAIGSNFPISPDSSS